jgi:hypothetical protein
MGRVKACGCPKATTTARAKTTPTTKADPYGMTNKKGKDKCNSNGWPDRVFTFPHMSR